MKATASAGGIGGADAHVMSYRADIDGLRAIAVWSVILFHISKGLIPNGFLGVDMFFVLSGYLITSIIWREMIAGTFKLSTFYNRRIRRIMPALLALLAVVSVAASIILLPADLIGYGKSVLATLVFGSNVYFWRDTDYFARAAEMKPLLHLWSLGVEEQFYLIFPLLMWLVALVNRKWALPMVLLVTLGSLAIDLGLRHFGGGSPAFYLSPSRGWELGIGALIAVAPLKDRITPMMAQAASALGAVLTVAGLAGFTPFELSPAAPVVVGTALMVLGGQHTMPAVSRLLALPPLVFFGKISYSLYLWHWPVLVLGRYYLVRDFRPEELALAVAAMVALAWLSWRFVERPFRENNMPIGKVQGFALAGSVAVAVAGFVLISGHGFPNRLSREAAAVNEAVDTHYRCGAFDMMPFGASRACAMALGSRDPTDADVVLLGNSHAQMYAPVWKEIVADRREKGLLVTLNGCLPTITANLPDCFGPAQQNLDAVLALPHVKTILLAFSWEVPELVLPDGTKPANGESAALIAGLDDLIARLESAGKRVILIGPIAKPGYDIASDYSRTIAYGRAFKEPLSVSQPDFDGMFGAAIAHFDARNDIVFVRPDKVQCAGGKCEFVVHGRSLYSDSNHLAESALPLYKPALQDALKRSALGSRTAAVNSVNAVR